ncbi:MAG: DEAD/DEAH box helicase [Actinopolymorphaceae bacterium]
MVLDAIESVQTQLALPVRGLSRAPKSTGGGRSRPPEWERSLSSLLEPTPTERVRSAGGDIPLAIELSLSGGPPSARYRPENPAEHSIRLDCRLVRPGRNGWVNGGLTWSRLNELDEYPARSVRLLNELYALYRSRDVAPYSYGYYSYRDEKYIDLSQFDSRQLWPLLDEAEAIGLRLLHARKGFGVIERYGSAELQLDVSRHAHAAESLVIQPAVKVDRAGVNVLPICFIGASGHGVVYADRAEARHGTRPSDWRFWIARLSEPVPAELQRVALEHRRIELPDDGLARFRDEYFPRLRRLATITSSDDSFTPPVISDPSLVLRASYGEGHALDVAWEWMYDVGDTRMRAPLSAAASETGIRDPEREREIVRDVLDTMEVPLDRFGLVTDGQGPLMSEPALLSRGELGGVDTLRFSTELLPLLSDHPGVAVEVDGEPADYREVDDSLRIGVSTDDVAGETDWFDLGITITVEGREIPFIDVFRALNGGESHMLLSDGAFFCLDKPDLQELRRLIEEAQTLQENATGALRISRFQTGLWDELATLGIVDRQADSWRRHVEALRTIDSLGAEQLPAALDASLRPYQVDGFRWLSFLWEFKLGGILADDMGLGKTLQSLALICQAKQDDPDLAPVLVVAPTSVVPNWLTESERFAPDLKVMPVFETKRRRLGLELDELAAGADVVVTSYTLFRLEFEAYAGISWSGLILDEAQAVKNHQSKIHQCARRLPVPFKLAITGTPMENNLMELWSLLSITAPGLFPSPTRFFDYYARPIEQRGSSSQRRAGNSHSAGDQPAAGELLAQLRRRIKPLVKRRTKEQVVAELPAKQEHVLEVDLHPRHRKVYEVHLQRERQKVLGLVDDFHKNRFTILRSLTLLRQLSLHAGLVDDTHLDLPSVKMDTLLEQLHDIIGTGHRALVFSQFTGFLAKIRQGLDTAGIDYCYLDGKTRKRKAVIEGFKKGVAPVFLISLKAGGFGLNLTEADYCFLLDPWWNPATETQAVDRAHRIGQTRNVMVYRLIAKNTIEQKVMALKAKKAELFSSVMDGGDTFGASLSAEDIRGLLA